VDKVTLITLGLAKDRGSNLAGIPKEVVHGILTMLIKAKKEELKPELYKTKKEELKSGA